MAGKMREVHDLLLDGTRDPQVARDLLERPVTSLAKIGVNVPNADDAEVQQHLPSVVPDLHQRLSDVATGNLGDWQPPGNCDGCKWGMAAFATTIIGLVAVAGGGALTASSAVVVELASMLGIEAGAALAAINTAIAVVGAGVTAVAQSLCTSVGLCS